MLNSALKPVEKDPEVSDLRKGLFVNVAIVYGMEHGSMEAWIPM